MTISATSPIGIVTGTSASSEDRASVAARLDRLAAAARPSSEVRATGQSREALSRNSYTPLYYQLAVILEERAENGEYVPGQEFPSEQQLCEEFGVSRTVVRPAMAILEREGRIARSKGKRTVVQPPKMRQEMGGLLRALLGSRADPDIELCLLEVRSEAQEQETAAMLGLQAGERVLRVAAVVYRNAVPLTLHWSFLPEPRFPWVTSLPVGERLRARGLHIPDIEVVRGEAIVESSWCTEFESAELDIPVGTPIFVARCIEFGDDDRALELAWTVHRADAARLSMALGPAVPETMNPTIQEPR
jgi:GntR family transcriptional regulator